MLAMLLQSLLSLIGNGFDLLTTMMLNMINLDLDEFETYIPGLSVCADILTQIGIVIVFFGIIYEAFRLVATPFSGNSGNASSPLNVIGRCFLAALFTFCGYTFTAYLIKNLVGTVYDTMLELMTDASDGLSFGLSFDSLIEAWNTIDSSSSLGETFNNYVGTVVFDLLGMILAIVVMWQIFKICWNMLYRYVALVLAAYLAPVCCAFYVSPSTDNISKMWARTILSQSVLLIFTAWGCRIATISIIDASTTGIAVLWKYVYLVMFIKFITKSDEFLQRLGFNTLPTAKDVKGMAGDIIGAVSSAGLVARNISALGKLSNGISSRRETAADGKAARAAKAFSKTTSADSLGNLTTSKARYQGAVDSINNMKNLSQADRAAALKNWKRYSGSGTEIKGVGAAGEFMTQKAGGKATKVADGNGFYVWGSKTDSRTGEKTDFVDYVSTDKNGIGNDTLYAEKNGQVYKGTGAGIEQDGGLAFQRINMDKTPVAENMQQLKEHSDAMAYANTLTAENGKWVSSSSAEGEAAERRTAALATMNSLASGTAGDVSNAERLKAVNDSGAVSGINGFEAKEVLGANEIYSSKDGDMQSLQAQGINAVGVKGTIENPATGEKENATVLIGQDARGIGYINSSGEFVKSDVAGTGKGGGVAQNGGFYTQTYKGGQGYTNNPEAFAVAKNSIRGSSGELVSTLPSNDPLYGQAQEATNNMNSLLGGGMNNASQEQLGAVMTSYGVNAGTANEIRQGEVVTPDKVFFKDSDGNTFSAQDAGLKVAMNNYSEYNPKSGAWENKCELVGTDVTAAQGYELVGGSLGSMSSNGGLTQQSVRMDSQPFTNDRSAYANSLGTVEHEHTADGFSTTYAFLNPPANASREVMQSYNVANGVMASGRSQRVYEESERIQAFNNIGAFSDMPNEKIINVSSPGSVIAKPQGASSREYAAGNSYHSSFAVAQTESRGKDGSISNRSWMIYPDGTDPKLDIEGYTASNKIYKQGGMIRRELYKNKPVSEKRSRK